ncbi:hypothetical protein [Roseivirga sp. E12]|uniref:hypothetical protein n=1 Tax=Roseivirga sp. E12 TaxID=2819237 RepID=UPI001ABD3F06|nr:hypothetical protein [Roseivirga sp. E12]MBO3697386.1 hypothetical protein [Roseivirga sp. E12]
MDLSEIFKVENSEELKSGKALNDPSLLENPVKLSASKAFDYSGGGFTFSIVPEASMTVSLFNSTDDEDPDKLINSPNAITPFSAANDSYLKYAFNVGATGSGAGNAGGLSLNLTLSSVFSTGLYKKHSPTNTVPMAVVNDVKSFLSIFDWTSVESLAIGDALFTSARGKMEGKIGFSWSDIFTKSMSSLANLLPGNLTLDIQMSPSVSVGFNASLEDNYLCAMTRTGADEFKVTINKTKSSSAAGQIGASVGIQFADPETLETQLNEIVDKIIASVTDYAGNVAELIQKFQTNSLSPNEKEFLDKILKRLKLDALADPVNSLDELIKNIEEKAKSTTKAIASASASVSFSYEYSRISENQELLSATITEGLLQELHPKLVGFNADQLLTEFQNGTDEITLDHYLNQKTLTIKKSWGFGLSFMGKPVFSGKTIRKTVSSTQTNAASEKQLSLDQVIGYQRQWMGEETDWVTDFNVKMPNFSAAPSLDEFDYSLYVQMTSGMKVKKVKHLKQLLDLGIMWGAIDEGEVPRLVEKYLDTFHRQVITADAQLTFKPTAMLALTQQLGQLGWNNVTIGLMAKAMASSMSYWNNYPLRQSVSKRTAAYSPTWQNYLSNPSQSLSSIASRSQDNLSAYGGVSTMLIDKEGQAGHDSSDDFVANIIYQNNGIARDAQSFVNGLVKLKQGIDGKDSFDSDFNVIYAEMKSFFGESFYVRTLGCLLNEFANINPALDGVVERVFTLSWGEGDDEQTVSLASKN